MDEKKTKEMLSNKLQGKKKRPKFAQTDMNEEELRIFQQRLFEKSRNFEWEDEEEDEEVKQEPETPASAV